MAVTTTTRFLKRSNTTTKPPSRSNITFTASATSAGTPHEQPTTSPTPAPPPNTPSTEPREPHRSIPPFPSLSHHRRQDSGDRDKDKDRERPSHPHGTQKQTGHKSTGSGEWRNFTLHRTLSLSKTNKSMEDFPFLKRTNTAARKKVEEHRRTYSAEEEPRDVWEAAEQDNLRSWDAEVDTPPMPRQRSVPGHRRYIGADVAQLSILPESLQPVTSPVLPRSPLGQASVMPPRSPLSLLAPSAAMSPTAADSVLASPAKPSLASKSLSRAPSTLVRVESLQERLSRSASSC